MEGLGRLFNLLPVGDGVWINLRDAGAVTFLGILSGGDTYTVQEATTLAGGSAANLATVTRAHTSTGIGTGAWTLAAQAAAATVVTTATAVVFTIEDAELSAGFDYIRCSSTSTGLVIAIAHDLDVQRAPANLAALSA